MKKILVMPFLKLSSGHHQAADAMIDWIKILDSSIECEKIDLLQYSYGSMEKWVSWTYVKWIHLFPRTYNWLYQKSVCRNLEQPQNYRLYELLFERYMYKLILEKRPDLIICTHALPSYMINQLKKSGLLSIPAVNVYTDYFINKIWGLQHIDYHLVPDSSLKEQLISRHVNEEQIFVTGIPVHPEIKKKSLKIEPLRQRSKISILITGGSLGAGMIKDLIKSTSTTEVKVIYKVLCGRNKRLYYYIKQLNHPGIIPLGYIDSRKEMDNLYDQTDAIVTKPGGVTISESLYKGLPIFIYHALPGQENYNLSHLKKEGLIFHIEDWNKENPMEDQLINLLQSKQNMSFLQKNMTHYQKHILNHDLASTLQLILNN